jgi:hypothetical protein
MMASGELSEILNLKLSGPRLFNEDGRVVTVTDNITDDQMRAGRDLSGEITSQLEDMQK